MAAWATWVQRAGVLLMVLAGPVAAQSPNYDAFSERDGEIATQRQEAAAFELVKNGAQLEAVYSDAAKGNVRAQHVWQQLEATFTATGIRLGDQVTSPGCLVMAYRELSKECVPEWAFLNLLAKDRPGANRLREAIFRAFAERARQRGLENQLIISAANGLIAIGVAGAIPREAEVAANVSSKGVAIEKAVADRWAKGTFNSVADSIEYHFSKHGNGRTLQQYTQDAVRFFQENKAQAQWGKWNPNWEPSYRLKVGNRGGYYTADGQVLSYWD
jgi:hypothetical protein